MLLMLSRSWERGKQTDRSWEKLTRKTAKLVKCFYHSIKSTGARNLDIPTAATNDASTF